MSRELQMLASHVADLRLDALPERIVAQGRRVLLDTAGAIVAASAEPELSLLSAELATGGPSSVLGTARRATPPWAAFLNALAGCWYDLDEGNRYARVHPGIHVAPVALAVGEETGATGTATLEALIAGYEVAARVGCASTLHPHIYSHGVAGSLGAAATAAKLHGADASGIATAIALAGALLVAPPFAAAPAGVTVRNAFAATGCLHGILAATLARAGLTPLPEAVEIAFGASLGSAWDAAALVADLGERFEIERNYFKPFATCRHSHGALDLLLHLRAERDFDGTMVDELEVVTYTAAAELNDASAATPLAARFSIPVLLALALRDGADLLHLDGLDDPWVRSMAARVRVTADPAADRAYPAARWTHLRVALADGRRLEARSEAAPGDAERPLTDADLDAKFLALTEPVLGDGATNALATWRTIDTHDDLQTATRWSGPVCP